MTIVPAFIHKKMKKAGEQGRKHLLLTLQKVETKGDVHMSIREYKSSVFSMLLETSEHALDAYNAVNGSHYTDPSQVMIQKLEDKILLSVRNDASFLLDSYLNLYEHQSIFNPNMPLRFLIYFSGMMKDMIQKNAYDLYGRKRIPVPTPRFVVFYNGLEDRPEKEVFYLSDSYEHPCEEYELELSCEVYNINPGKNEELLRRSRVLFGYTRFVEKVRKFAKESDSLKKAVGRAIDECVEEGILAEFFIKRREEVLEMAALDFTFERREKLIARDNREEGREEGVQRVNRLYSLLQERDRTDDILRSISDRDYQNQLFEEFHLVSDTVKKR